MREIVLDCLGETCPKPLLKAENALKELESGDFLIIQVDMDCAIKKVPEWARENGYNVEIEEISGREREVIIEKK